MTNQAIRFSNNKVTPDTTMHAIAGKFSGLWNARLILTGFGFGLVFWFLEAVIDVLAFGAPSLLEQIIAPPVHEVWMRLLVTCMFAAFGFYAHHVVNLRRRSEEEVNKAHAELAQIFDTAADGMRVVDKDFVVLRANNEFARLVAMSKDTIIGKKCHDVFRGPMCDTPDCPLTRILEQQQPISYEAVKERSDGVKIPCIVTATPFRRPNGEVTGIVEDFKDISALKNSERQLMESHQQLRELTSHLQQVREDERSKVSREIHDELGQTLTVLKMDLYWLKNRNRGGKTEILDKIEAMMRVVSDTIKSVRKICSELRPQLLDDYGLSASIEWQAEEFTRRTGIACKFSSEPAEILLDRPLSIAVFRLCQESLTNIIRHAQASAVKVEMKYENGMFQMQIHDDGQGIDLTRKKANSFGVIGMQERVHEFGGELTVAPGPNRGTIVSAIIPIMNKGN